MSTYRHFRSNLIYIISKNIYSFVGVSTQTSTAILNTYSDPSLPSGPMTKPWSMNRGRVTVAMSSYVWRTWKQACRSPSKLPSTTVLEALHI